MDHEMIQFQPGIACLSDPFKAIKRIPSAADRFSQHDLLNISFHISLPFNNIIDFSDTIVPEPFPDEFDIIQQQFKRFRGTDPQGRTGMEGILQHDAVAINAFLL